MAKKDGGSRPKVRHAARRQSERHAPELPLQRQRVRQATDGWPLHGWPADQQGQVTFALTGCGASYRPARRRFRFHGWRRAAGQRAPAGPCRASPTGPPDEFAAGANARNYPAINRSGGMFTRTRQTVHSNPPNGGRVCLPQPRSTPVTRDCADPVVDEYLDCQLCGREGARPRIAQPRIPGGGI